MRYLNMGLRYRSSAGDVDKGVTRVSEQGFGDYKGIKTRCSEQSE